MSETTETPWRAEAPPAPAPPAVLAEACDAFARKTGYQLCARAWLGGSTWRLSAYREGAFCGYLFAYTGSGPGCPCAKFSRTGPGATGGLALALPEREALAAVRGLLAAGGEVGVDGLL